MMSNAAGDQPIYEDKYLRLYEVRGEDVPAGQEYVIEHKLLEGQGDRYITRFQFGTSPDAPNEDVLTEIALLEMLRHRVMARWKREGHRLLPRALAQLAGAQLAFTDMAIDVLDVDRRAQLDKASQLAKAEV
jgi:hypothetical protein